MRVGGKGALDHLTQLWQLQNNAPAAQKEPARVDRYKDYMINKNALEKVRTATHGGKRKRSRMSTPGGAPQSLRQGKAPVDAATPSLSEHPVAQSPSSLTNAAPLQPLSKYRQIAESDQRAGTESNLVVTA